MTSANLRNLLALLLVATGLTGCLSGQGSSSGSSSGTSGGTTTTTTSTKPTLALALASSLPATTSNTVTAVTFGTSIYAVATVKDASGAPVANAVVSFAAANPMIVFNPTSASALTGSDGKASIKLDAASISDAGATSLTASAEVTTTSSGTSSTATYTSAPLGVAVNASGVTLGTLTLGQSSISAYGTSVVSVPVLINGTTTDAPISVTFTSPCVSSGKATLSSPVTSAAGVATSTYKDNNCASSSDVITASVSGSTSRATINVALPAASNMQFVSATPGSIGIQGTGSPLPQSSTVKFKVVDSTGNGKAGVLVDFSLLQANAPGGAGLSPTSATSDANGEVTTAVTSGSMPTPVSVIAKVHDTPSILSQSNTLTVTTGLPAQGFFSLTMQTHNIEGWAYDGITSQLFVIASDRMGNPVPDGTAVNFIAEGGQIVPPSCTTSNGACSVTFKSAQYKPQDETTTVRPSGAVAALDDNGAPITDHLGNPLYVKNGRVSILAYAVGEMSFIDANGNNVYDTGETFYDLGDPFIDSNENRSWDSNSTQPNLREQYLNFTPVASPVACLTRNVNGGSAALPASYGDALSATNTCSGVWGKAYVRRNAVLVLSGSVAKLSQYNFPMASSCSRTFYFWLMDENNNPMPVGTTVELGTASVAFTEPGASATAATVTVGGSPVIDTSHAGGTLVAMTVDGGVTCTGLGTYPAGSVQLLVKTPLGLGTGLSLSVN